jgi:hypothetical protein
VGKEEGLIFFRTPDQLEEFDRIKDVVDRVMMRKDPAEALAADAYEANLARGGAGGGHGTGTRGGAAAAATGKADGATSAAMSSSAARRAAVLPGLHPGKPHPGAGGSAKSPNGPDVSWKEGRSFPKKSSSIGNRYQVSHIPEAGTFDPTQPPESDQLYVRSPVLGLPVFFSWVITLGS